VLKIVFYAHHESFDFFRVGGTDSFLRRLSFAMLDIDQKVQIEYVLYGKHNKAIYVSHRFKLIYIQNFPESLKYLSSNDIDHVVSTWLLLKDRNKFSKFAKNLNKKIKFHKILFFYPGTLLKKLVKFYELILYKNNGKNFIVSLRQSALFRIFDRGLIMLNPPVDGLYFAGRVKEASKKIKITFLGRLDPRKGVNKVINIFQELKPLGLFELSIYGIHIAEDPESMEIYEWLKNQDSINFYEVEREKFTPEIDQLVVDVLHETDIFIQPYQDLDSTVDTPLLILEAMACNCAVISTKISPVLDIYKESEFLFDYDNFEKQAIGFLKGITHKIVHSEKQRVFLEAKYIYKYYESKNVAQGFLNAIK
jgi:glycosyltransferase involved in cell wall biosynthesis